MVDESNPHRRLAGVSPGTVKTVYSGHFCHHYFLYCHFFDALWATFVNDLKNIDSDLTTFRDENLTNILYGNQLYDDKTNQIILMHVVRYIKDSQRFD